MNKKGLLLTYIISDIVASTVVWVLFMLFRKIVNDGIIFDGIHIFFPNYNYYSSLFLFPIACVFVHYLSGFYLNLYNKTRITSIFTTLFASGVISIIIFFVLLLDDVVVSYEFYYYSLLVLFGLLFFITLIFRSIIASHVRFNFKTKKWTINTVIVGTGNNALKIACDFEKSAKQNTLVGFIAIDHFVAVPGERVLGNMNQLSTIIENNHIEDSIVVLDNADENQLFSIINQLYKYNINIQFTPRLYEILTGSAKISKLGIIPLVSITNSSMSDCETSIKRFLDIVFSFLSLILLSPFLFYFMIKIKRDSKGPIFYKQERIGRFGKPFNILKFRTMSCDSENGMPQLSSANDNRITDIGRVLRKYRIDEIPQFWNILKGDMSLVGPRPERAYFINQIIEDAPYYCLLYKIRPGLTSWGPIKIGYSDTIEKMIERLNYDIIYMDNMSLITDLKILIYTLEIIFKGKGI